MPLVKRAVSPVDVSRGCVQKHINNNELLCVANGTLANLIRQLGSLSKHAEHAIGEIFQEAIKLDHKASILQQRISNLVTKVEKLDAINEQATLDDVKFRKPFKSKALLDQHSLDRSTLPAALSDAYARCDAPPNLDALNPFRDDPAPALSLYTNPSFFFDLWRQEMLKDCPDPRRRVKSPSEGQKSPKKKRKPVQQPVDGPRVHPGRFAQGGRPAQFGVISFPEEYQAPEALGIRRDYHGHGYQPLQNTSPLIPPPGMSVRAPPLGIERNERSSHSPPIQKRDLPPPDMSLLALDDDDDDLPPPPPTLMCTSLVQQMPSPPQTNIQLVPSEQQPVAPIPPPPPPPPANLMSTPLAATFASSALQAQASTSAPKETNRPAPKTDLLAEIRQGFALKKVVRAEEAAAEKAAAERGGDVAAILKRHLDQMQAVMHDDDSGSSVDDDGEWDE